MHEEAIERYGLEHIADVRIFENQFQIEVIKPETTELEGCIYAFVVNGEIVRVGSSRAPLKFRLSSWRRDVSRALAGMKSGTSQAEAEGWRNLLSGEANGGLYARQATLVTTPVGTFTAHLDEERVLLLRYKPLMNRSSR